MGVTRRCACGWNLRWPTRGTTVPRVPLGPAVPRGSGCRCRVRPNLLLTGQLIRLLAWVYGLAGGCSGYLRMSGGGAPMRSKASPLCASGPARSGLGLSAFYVALLVTMCGFIGATIVNSSVDAALGYATSETGPWWRQRLPRPITRWQTLLAKWAVAVPGHAVVYRPPDSDRRGSPGHGRAALARAVDVLLVRGRRDRRRDTGLVRRAGNARAGAGSPRVRLPRPSIVGRYPYPSKRCRASTGSRPTSSRSARSLAPYGPSFTSTPPETRASTAAWLSPPLGSRSGSSPGLP